MLFKAKNLQSGFNINRLLFMTSIPERGRGRYKKNPNKFLLAMKMTVALIFLACLSVSGKPVEGQTVSLSVTNAKLETVFKEIKKQTGYVFFYDRQILTDAKLVSLHVKAESVADVLKQSLRGQPLGFTITKETVTVFRTTLHSRSNLASAMIDEKLAAVVESPKAIITGTVKDVQGNLLVGVSVVVKGTTRGTSTNSEGRFSIEADQGQTLVFTFVGYNAAESVVGSSSVINVTMTVAASGLDEVVVVGYGTQTKGTMTGSVVSVDGNKVAQNPVPNISNSLTGRLPGLAAIQARGEPGNDEATLLIRGVNTFGNNSPLIVVDGIKGRSLSRLDPYSVESITVLKDASAAIYGSEAANGVILVTTKKGKVGHPEISLNFNQGFNQPTRIPKMDNAEEYAIQLNELDLYQGRPLRFSEADIQKFKDGSDPWRFPNTDWFSEVLKTWSQQNDINANLNGGSDNIRYFVSLGTQFQDAYYKHSATNYRQYNFLTNINGKISNYVNVLFNISGRLEDRNFPTVSSNSIFRSLFTASPQKPAFWPDGSSGPDIIDGLNPAVVSTNASGSDKNKQYFFNSELKIDLKIPWISGLSFTVMGSYDGYFQFRKLLQTPWTIHGWDGVTVDQNNNPILSPALVGYQDPRLTEFMQNNSQTLFNGILNYNLSIERHNLRVLLGTESVLSKGSNFNAFRRHYVTTVLPELFAGGDSDKDNGGSSFERARLDYFGRLNYSYGDKYLLEFLGRYDGSYLFPKTSRYGFFPGISAGWVISKENFWQKRSASVSYLKLRASWGQTGNDQISEWEYLSTYAYRTGVYVFGDEESKKLYEARTPNDKVTWEVANQSNIGLDMSFLSDKIDVSIDYFHNRRTNILWYRNASVPNTAGITLPRENIGEVVNKGFEFTVGYQNRVQDFTYNISINGGYARNKIIFWDEAPGTPSYQQSTGKPVPSSTSSGADLYYEAIGIFKDQREVDDYPHWEGASAGDIIFKDVNGDGIIDGNDRVRNDKSNIPRFTGGVNANFGYKNLDFSILFQSAIGAVRYIYTESGEIGNYLEDFFKKRWTSENPNADGPRTYNRTSVYWTANANTYFLHRTDYLRLKTFQIGYTLPLKVNEKLAINNVRIYISGYNLFTYSPDLKDFDPESQYGGFYSQSYPPQRIINFGINLKF